MQRFAAKAGIGAAVLAIAAVAFLAGSAIEDGNAAVIQGQEVTRGIEWVNFTTGVDYNAAERDASGDLRKKKQYFAEIHLLILLKDKDMKKQVDDLADDPQKLPELKDLLTKQLDHNWPGFEADSTLIAALMLRH